MDEGGRVKEQHTVVGTGAEAAAVAGWHLCDRARRGGRPVARRERKTELVQADDIQELPAS